MFSSSVISRVRTTQMIETDTDSCRLRNASLEDGVDATEFIRGLGLSMPETREAIDAHWRRLWVDNPAMACDGPKPPLGWVLEKNDRMVGFFCNVPLLYYFGERRVIVAVASQWGLDKRHRRKIHRLAGAYFNQDHADILMATTANSSAGRIFRHYGAGRIPQPDYEQVLYWIIDGGGFIGAAMKRKNVAPFITSVLSTTTRPLVGFALAMGWRRPKGHEEKVDLIGVEDIDDRFDDLWKRKQAEAERLLACRMASNLRWHFGDTQCEKGTRILAHRRGGLRGYAVVMREDEVGIGLKRLRIADLFVETNDEVVVNDLLSAAYEYGREQGCHILEWVGMPTDLRQIAHRHSPFIRTLPTWPLYYKTMDVGLTSSLERQTAWYITPYDGDTTLV